MAASLAWERFKLYQPMRGPLKVTAYVGWVEHALKIVIGKAMVGITTNFTPVLELEASPLAFGCIWMLNIDTAVY
jgi:hypothetical protein